MKRRRDAIGPLVLGLSSLLLTGCDARPSYETVALSARTDAQAVIDELPHSAIVKEVGDEAPWGCPGDAAFFTGHWLAEVDAAIDVELFIAELPQRVPNDFAVVDLGVELHDPGVTFTHDGNTIAVRTGADGRGRLLDVLVISRCGQLGPTEHERGARR